ncbi:hypothetical protein [Candidatus Methylomicrobium oryzae]|uniref:hypothetical protein n=1 Tax=Candidatus Methylomicrobium oryzae TaxID=2802053 RepID=UPI001920BDB4|nr:hypothetical protein [Methylomicrobium sp. RS1]MBL1264930.1 hypothetical protein [Methylomicrobium sp. RS1]
MNTRIACAKNGDAASAFNLLNYFCYLVERDQSPPQPLREYVVFVLTKLYPNQAKHGKIPLIKKRFADLKKQGIRLRESRRHSPASASVLIAEEFDISEDHAIKLLYSHSESLIGKFVHLVATAPENRDLDKKISLLVRHIAHRMMSTRDRQGELLRSKLNIDAFQKQPQGQFHQDIWQQFQSLQGKGMKPAEAYRSIAEVTGLSYDAIKKTIQRKTKEQALSRTSCYIEGETVTPRRKEPD